MGNEPALGASLVGGANPWAVRGPVPSALYLVGSVCLLTALVAAAAALVQRFRRAAGVERQQLKWVAFAATVAGVLLPVVWLLWGITPAVAGVLAAAALSASRSPPASPSCATACTTSTKSSIAPSSTRR